MCFGKKVSEGITCESLVKYFLRTYKNFTLSLTQYKLSFDSFTCVCINAPEGQFLPTDC